MIKPLRILLLLITFSAPMQVPVYGQVSGKETTTVERLDAEFKNQADAVIQRLIDRLEMEGSQTASDQLTAQQLQARFDRQILMLEQLHSMLQLRRGGIHGGGNQNKSNDDQLNGQLDELNELKKQLIAQAKGQLSGSQASADSKGDAGTNTNNGQDRSSGLNVRTQPKPPPKSKKTGRSIGQKPASLTVGLQLKFRLDCGCTGEIYLHQDGKWCLHHYHRHQMTTHYLPVWRGAAPAGSVQVAKLADGQTAIIKHSARYYVLINGRSRK